MLVQVGHLAMVLLGFAMASSRNWLSFKAIGWVSALRLAMAPFQCFPPIFNQISLKKVGSFTVTDVQPHIISAKSAANATDSPTYTQAINSPHAEKWWDAMESELTTLESDLQAWELVP
jgi:hypothetical protein